MKNEKDTKTSVPFRAAYSAALIKNQERAAQEVIAEITKTKVVIILSDYINQSESYLSNFIAKRNSYFPFYTY